MPEARSMRAPWEENAHDPKQHTSVLLSIRRSASGVVKTLDSPVKPHGAQTP
jgi:hypothetical protein